MFSFRSNIYIYIYIYFLYESNKSLYMLTNDDLILYIFNLKNKKDLFCFMYQSVINVTSNYSTCFSM